MDVDLEPPPPPPSPTPSPPPPPPLPPQDQIETQHLQLQHGAVSDTGLPVQSIQESIDSRGNRIVIIEELDTPATRRERTRRAKAERARLAEVTEGHPIHVPEASGSGENELAVSPALADPALHLGQESDLSSLSGDSDEGSGREGIQASTSAGRGRGRRRALTQGKTGKHKSPGIGSISLPPGERLESGTLGISPGCHRFLKPSLKEVLQFGRSTSRSLGGVRSCMMTTCRRSR